jgi:hypothetical protein
VSALFSLSQWKAWLIAAVSVVAAVFFLVAKIRADGARVEKINQMEATLRRKKVEADVAAENAALSARIRRERLRQRWSRK